MPSGRRTVSPHGSSPRVWGTYIGGRPKKGGRAVHPHECGEHGRSFYLRSTRTRFIPTSVGNMCIRLRRGLRLRGSSPRVWGTYAVRVAPWFLLRFIPTSVGNMPVPGSQLPPPAVHPHECGEHMPSGRRTVSPHGSSPRVWGTFHYRRARRPAIRFIPTSVGNMSTRFAYCLFRQRFIPTSVGNMPYIRILKRH